MRAEQVWAWTDAQRVLLADALEGLAAADWDKASLCAGWRVRDVVAHLTLSARVRPAAALPGLIKARGNFNRYVADDAKARAARPAAELVSDLRAIVGVRRHPPGLTPRDPLADVIVHTQDIAIPLGLEVPVQPEAAAVAADRIWTMVPFPFFAKRRARSVSLRATDADWRRGDGPEVTGPILAHLTALTGRTALLDQLGGAGREMYAARFRA